MSQACLGALGPGGAVRPQPLRSLRLRWLRSGIGNWPAIRYRYSPKKNGAGAGTHDAKRIADPTDQEKVSPPNRSEER